MFREQELKQEARLVLGDDLVSAEQVLKQS